MEKEYKYKNTQNTTYVPSRFDLYKEGNVLTINKDGVVVQAEPQGGVPSDYDDVKSAVKQNTKSINTLQSQFDTLNIGKLDTNMSNASLGSEHSGKVLGVNSNGGIDFVDAGGGDSLVKAPNSNTTTIDIGKNASEQLKIVDMGNINITSPNYSQIGVNSLYIQKNDDSQAVEVEAMDGYNTIQVLTYLQLPLKVKASNGSYYKVDIVNGAWTITSDD